MSGQLLGHYRVLEKIGAGAMGEVFRARDERLGRDVAVKLIRPASSDNPDHLRRFEQEARAAAALNHPNILAIYDVGFEGTTPYIVSELLEGKNLRFRLQEGPIPVKEAADYALQIAQGLTAAHDRLIVHRDLKPENLFLTNDGRIKILDFGVAKLQVPAEENRSIESLTTVTKHGAVIGTVAYMSPEQLRAKPVDHRSDIFSFGAILYEMMSGYRAFHGETEVDTMTAVLREEPAGSNLEQAAIPVGISGHRQALPREGTGEPFPVRQGSGFCAADTVRNFGRRNVSLSQGPYSTTRLALGRRSGTGRCDRASRSLSTDAYSRSLSDLQSRDVRGRHGIFGTLHPRRPDHCVQRSLERQAGAAVYHGWKFPSVAASKSY